MDEVTVYGASDDLIEVEGAISEEVNHMDEEPCYLAFSDGTVLEARYRGNGGMWRINRVAEGSASYSKIEGADPHDDYTDRVTLRGDLKHVTFGAKFVRAKKTEDQ